MTLGRNSLAPTAAPTPSQQGGATCLPIARKASAACGADVTVKRIFGRGVYGPAGGLLGETPIRVSRSRKLRRRLECDGREAGGGRQIRASAVWNNRSVRRTQAAPWRLSSGSCSASEPSISRRAGYAGKGGVFLEIATRERSKPKALNVPLPKLSKYKCSRRITAFLNLVA